MNNALLWQMTGVDPLGEDRLARALAGGPAAVEQMAAAVQWIELRGGPLEGRTVPEGRGNPLPELRLMYPPDPPDPRPTPEGESILRTLVYRRQGGVRYVYRETLERSIPSAEYDEIKKAGEVIEKLRKLIADQRLADPPRADAGLEDPLPLEEAVKLKRRGVARFRREAAEAGRAAVGLLSDEQVWGYLRGTMLADLEWRDLGSVIHHKGLVLRARERFGLSI